MKRMSFFIFVFNLEFYDFFASFEFWVTGYAGVNANVLFFMQNKKFAPTEKSEKPKKSSTAEKKQASSTFVLWQPFSSGGVWDKEIL